MLCGLLCFFLEGMKHINRVGKLCHVDHPKCPGFFVYADFLNSLPYSYHWLPVVWFTARLQQMKLITCILPRILWELDQIPVASTYPPYFLHAVTYEIIQNLAYLTSRLDTSTQTVQIIRSG